MLGLAAFKSQAPHYSMRFGGDIQTQTIRGADYILMYMCDELKKNASENSLLG